MRVLLAGDTSETRLRASGRRARLTGLSLNQSTIAGMLRSKPPNEHVQETDTRICPVLEIVDDARRDAHERTARCFQPCFPGKDALAVPSIT